MKLKVWVSLGVGVAVVLILFIVFSKFFTPGSSSASELTEQEAKEIAQQRYSGFVQEIKQEADQYIIELERDTGIYEVQINSNTGEVSSLKRIQERKVETKNPTSDNEQKLNEEPNKEQDQVEPGQSRLSEEKAIAIALEQIPGEVDDIDLENKNGVSYFLVEVEANDGREATVEINAITAAVESITWDDQDDDDDDD
ncbi:PepSY domain-containing protein [Niallia sp. Krafla_26]|uniref:PepSY domain-containing protein n=1 Tax=Niallia sp. Krafla_26 TaxID=3064703 RepID=UPI003D1669F1